MKLQFAVWIAIIGVFLHKSTCISSDINQVASERRDIDFDNDEENEEKIIENDLLSGASLRDFPAPNATPNSTSTSDIPKITWSLVSLSKNSTSQFTQDGTSAVPPSKAKSPSLSTEATTSMPLDQNSPTSHNFTSSFPHALDSGDNELDSEISGIATEHIPQSDVISSKDYKISTEVTTTSYPTTEFSESLPENEKANSSYEVTTNFGNESLDEITTYENAFKDFDPTDNYLDDVFNSTDYLNFTSAEDFKKNASTDEDYYVTFIPDQTTNDFPPFETDRDVVDVNEEDTNIASSTVNHSNSPKEIEFTSPATSFDLPETTSPISIPEDVFTQTLETESSETVQDRKNQIIGVDSESTTLPSTQTETPFPQESDLDSIDNNMARADFDDKFPAFDNESTENAMEYDNNLVPSDVKSEMEKGTSEGFTVPPTVRDDEYFQTTETAPKTTNPTKLVPVHPLFTPNTNTATEIITSDSHFPKESLSSSTATFNTPFSSTERTDIPSKETEKSIRFPPDNITNSFENDVLDDVSNVATTQLSDDTYKFETSTPDPMPIATTLSEMPTYEDPISNELLTRDDQTSMDETNHDSTVSTTTLNEVVISNENQDQPVTDDEEFGNYLFDLSKEYPSTTKKINLFQPPTLPYDTDDSETMTSIPPITNDPLEYDLNEKEFSTSETMTSIPPITNDPLEYDLNEKEFSTSDPKLTLSTTISPAPEQFDVQNRGTTVSNEISEGSTAVNFESTTIPILQENASHDLEFENVMPSSQDVTETYREGKHIPFSTRATYERRPSKPTVPSSINPNLKTADTEVGTLYNQVKPEDLTREEKSNVVTAILQIHPLHYEKTELNEKIIIAHLWLLHAIVESYKNNSLNLTADVKRVSSTVAFEKLPKISYVLPTPDIETPNITLSFVAQLIGKNDTIPAEYLLNVLNLRKEDLKILANVKSVQFYHGFLVKEFDFLTAIMERHGTIVLVTCVSTIGMIILLICVVVYYKRKARHSAHCLTNDKLHRNMQEAMGIDLNPAVIILQDEIREKTALNGNTVCSIDDDEGWLAPIDDVPVPEDTNGPCIQDTKL